MEITCPRYSTQRMLVMLIRNAYYSLTEILSSEQCRVFRGKLDDDQIGGAIKRSVSQGFRMNIEFGGLEFTIKSLVDFNMLCRTLEFNSI